MSDLKNLITHIIPTECSLCQKPGHHHIPNLCNRCEGQLPYLKHYCYRCALPTTDPESVCGLCLKTPHSYDESYCSMSYESPVSNLIAKAKYNRELTSLLTLGSAFIKSYKLYKHPGHQITPDVIVAIPLSRQRQFIRGFNQSQVLAEIVADQLAIPLDNQILKRTRHTLPQRGLKKAVRLKNLKGSFQSSANAQGLNIVLFDDVITTGATMEAAASTLKKAGAKSVLAWSLVRTAQL